MCQFNIFIFCLLLCYIPTRRHHGAIVIIVFLVKLRLRIPKVGIIRNEFFFLVFIDV